jgi:hypothetical protein
MLDAWVPSSGNLLKVGNLDYDSMTLYRCLLSPELTIHNLKAILDPGAHFGTELFEAVASTNVSFDATTVCELSSFKRPSEVLKACARVTATQGVGLFGLVSDTDTINGSTFHPHRCHLWRRDKEPLTNLEGSRNAWAFDREGLEDLFGAWGSIQVESMGHHWFVVARKT